MKSFNKLSRKNETQDKNEARRGRELQLDRERRSSADINLSEPLYTTMEIAMTSVEDSDALRKSGLEVVATVDLGGPEERVALLRGDYEGELVVGVAKIFHENEDSIQLENPKLVESLDDKFSIGRDGGVADYIAGDRYTSRNHVELSFVPDIGHAIIKDHSSNGTVVRAQKPRLVLR